MISFSSGTSNVTLSPVRSLAPALPAQNIEQLIVEDLTSIPEVVSVRLEHENGELLVFVGMNDPVKDIRYKVYDRQMSLIRAFPEVDLNFNLVHAE